MDRRRLLLILAVFVALLGTGLVFLYVKGADARAKTSYVTAYVAAQPIGAGETYEAALNAGKIKSEQVDSDYVASNPGAITSADAVAKTDLAVSQILQGQVITKDQWGGVVKDANPSTLPIPPGMIAISVNLTDPDRVAGNIENGSQVAIFVTGTLQTSATQSSSLQSTRLLLPKVTVLNVGSPQPAVTSTTTDQNGTQTTEQLPRTLLTIAVTQKDAQKVILSSKALTLTFGLLTSKSKVHPAPGTSTLVASLFR
jgi:pilus assembly protein CpaB